MAQNHLLPQNPLPQHPPLINPPPANEFPIYYFKDLATSDVNTQRRRLFLKRQSFRHILRRLKRLDSDPPLIVKRKATFFFRYGQERKTYRIKFQVTRTRKDCQFMGRNWIRIVRRYHLHVGDRIRLKFKPERYVKLNVVPPPAPAAASPI